MIERVFGLDVLAALADGAGDLRFPVDLLQAERDRDVVIGAGKRARRLEKEVRLCRRFLAGEFRTCRGRHAGTQHLVDVLLKVLRGVEHLAGFWHRRQCVQACELGGARSRSFLLDNGDDFLQHGKVCVPVFQKAGDAVAGAQNPRARISRVRRRQRDNVVAQHDGGEKGRRPRRAKVPSLKAVPFICHHPSIGSG